MEILRFLSGPLIGAVIGFFTNYIAVKMLFYPRKEIRVFGRVLPFTPGAIPKGKTQLAKAIGAAIENNLLTKADIESLLLSPAAEKKVTETVLSRLAVPIRPQLLELTGLEEDVYREKRKALCDRASREIIRAVQDAGVTETVLRQVADSLREKAQGTAWHLLVNSRTIGSVMEPAKERLDRAIDRHGAEQIAPIIEKELMEIDGNTGLHLLSRFDRDEDWVREALVRSYRRLVAESAERILAHFHIAALVEDKINAMSVAELERLVWSVMRKELHTIVGLGGLIGFVLGLFNSLF